MALGWRQGSLQAQPGTCMPRPRFLFVAASPSYRRAGALSREAAGCQQSRPDGRWSWPGPGRGCLGKESPQGPGRQKGPPGVVQHPPLPAGAGGKSTPKGTLSSSPDSAAVSYPTGRAAALGRGALAAGLLEGAGGGLSPPAWGSDPRRGRCTAGTPPTTTPGSLWLGRRERMSRMGGCGGGGDSGRKLAGGRGRPGAAQRL